MINEDDVVRISKTFLGLERGECKFYDKNKLTYYSLSQLILESKDFQCLENQERLKATNLNNQHVIDVYKIILLRYPESIDIIKQKVHFFKNIHALLFGLINSTEYLANIEHRNILGSERFNRKPKIIYLHIPKTAGKSFENLVNRVYEGRDDNCCLSTTGKFNLELLKNASLVGGHFCYDYYTPVYTNKLFLSVVRNPIERAISRFNFYTRTPGVGTEERIKNGFNVNSLKATIENVKFRKEFVDNIQCKYLSGFESFEEVKDVFKKNNFIVGSFKSLNDWTNYISEKLGWGNFELPKVNQSSNENYLDEYYNDKELIEMLYDLNKEDFKLYEFIKACGVYSNCDNFGFWEHNT